MPENAKEAERKAAEQAFISRFTNRRTPKQAEPVQMPDGTIAFMTRGEQKRAMGQGINIRGGSTGRATEYYGHTVVGGPDKGKSYGKGSRGSGYSMGPRGTGGATPP